MSFVRAGRSQQHIKGKRPVRQKKTGVPRRDWVSTVNDLSVHKLTPEELNHRHEIHKSHNKAAAQWELREKEIKRRLRHGGSPAPMDQASLSIIREVFSDQMLLQDVLARSDRALAVVKDLFADAPRRQTGQPSVTMAPNCDSDSALPLRQRPDPLTRRSCLSKAVMDLQALNELETSEEDTSPTDSPDYQVIRRANIRKMKPKTQSKVIQKQRAFANSEQGDNVPVTPCTSGREPSQTALNATVAVKRVQSRQSQSEDWKEDPAVLVSQVLNPELPLNQSDRINSRSSRRRNWVPESSELDGSSVGSLNRNQSSLGLLQTMLDQVEADLDSLTPDTVPVSIKSPGHHRTQGLTGFSVALVSTLGRLVNLLKQREEEAQRDAQEKRNLQEELREQRGLIDALTAEVMTVRQETAILQAGLQQQQTELEQKLDMMALAMTGLDLHGKRVNPPQDSVIKAAVSQPVSLHQELPTGKELCSCDDMPTQSSAASLISWPCTSSVSLTSDPLNLKFSHESLMAEIAYLSRQNELLKVQLCQQMKDLGSRDRGSPNSIMDQRRLNSSSTERTMPQNVGEKRISASSSTERTMPQNVGEKRISASSSTERTMPQNVGEKRISASSSTERTMPQNVGERKMSASSSTGGSPQLTQYSEGSGVGAPQVTSPNALSVEQRLLELNRQSAAARSRLLELIEQQKQSVSARVSPTLSPIPPSAVSPHTAVGGQSPEVSMPLSSQEPLPHTSGGDRIFAAGEVFSQSLGGEIKNVRSQTDKRKEQKGWFSLSAHTR